MKSIRSRLALSFAGIALMAAVALGVVLLAILQNYYAKMELDYLSGNAQTASNFVAEMMASNPAHDEVQSQIENLAFLTQTRIQVYNAENQQLYDSGSPQNIEINLASLRQVITQTNGTRSDNAVRIIAVAPKPNRTGLPRSLGVARLGDSEAAEQATPSSTQTENVRFFTYRTVHAGASPFGFELNAGPAASVARSNATVTEPVLEPQNDSSQNGHVIGSVKLSEGPALGTAIVASVAQGWAVASVVAVLLAAGAGGYISRRISAPVLALTNVTTRMAQGDLSSRASIEGQDEFGQLARSFNEMAEQVETTVTTLHRFVSDAAHELHTPLTALRADLDLAAEENKAAVQQTLVKHAQTTLLRLESLTDNLLDLSRLEAQTDKEPAEPLDLAELVRQSAEAYASQAEQAGLTFTMQVPDEPLRIKAYAKQVQRTLNNLFDNACKFTSPGGSVAIQLQREGNHVHLSVSDTGIGIPPDDLPQVFNRFHRSRNATDYPGSGLGLAIVKAIVEQQGGKVLVENRTPGARFILQWEALP